MLAADNILADVRCGTRLWGDEFQLSAAPVLKIKLIGTANFQSIDIVRNSAYVYTAAPDRREVELTWADPRVNFRAIATGLGERWA